MGRAGQPREVWDLLNMNARYGCYPRAVKGAKGMARNRKIPILLRHHGPRHGEDDTRVNQYVHPDGRVDIRRDEGGKAIDAA